MEKWKISSKKSAVVLAKKRRIARRAKVRGGKKEIIRRVIDVFIKS